MYTPTMSTERLVELAIERARNPKRILDLGCGSGWIAERLKDTFPEAEVWATDIRKNDFSWREDICWRQCDLFKGVYGLFDIIVTNPPYLSEQEWRNIGSPKPKTAYTSDTFLPRFLAEFRDYLTPGGIVCMETSPNLVAELGGWGIIAEQPTGIARYAVWVNSDVARNTERNK